MPVPPRPPAPRPCFLPPLCGRLPRNLRVLETISALLDEHPHEGRIECPSAVAEVPAVVESALDAAKSPARRRQTEDGPELPDVGEGRLAFRDRLAQIPDRLELAVALHERVIDRLVADLTTSLQEEFGEDFRVDFAPGDMVLHELEHPAERRVLRDDRAMVLAGQVEHAERVLHVLPEIAFPSEPQDGEAHSSGASSSFGSSAGPSVRASPSTEPLRPVTLNGSVWARPQPHSHEPQPRLISIMLSFALSIARRIDGPTSRPRARPRPAKPSLLPTMHVITKFTRRPESVIRCTMLTSRTSSSVSGRRTSTISGSRIGSPVRIASPSVVSSPARTRRPSFVFGAHSLRFRSGLAARASRLPPRPPRRGGLRGPPVSSSPRRTASGPIPRCAHRGPALSSAARPGYAAPRRRNRGDPGAPRRGVRLSKAAAAPDRGSPP